MSYLFAISIGQMKWADYLSLLSWQGCKIFWRDFINLKSQPVKNPENFVSLVSSPETKEYLTHNKYWWKKAEKDYKHCQNQNYQILHPGIKAYPKNFSHFFETAPILLILGQWPSEPAGFSVTCVGSRVADEQALNWMDFYLSPLIQEKQLRVISGGARGIDQKAHKIAVRSQSPTLCFLPSGLDHFYPESLKTLKTDILDCGGAFISCFPPWQKMNKFYFHIRNSLLPLCSSLVLILQAQIRSGTMLTAQKSLEYGIPLAVLPGPALSARWTGNLQLLYDGAYLVRDNLDLSLLIESLRAAKSPSIYEQGDSK